jgi:hypothetical protein
VLAKRNAAVANSFLISHLLKQVVPAPTHTPRFDRKK